MEVGGGFQYAHPYSSVISAKVIGNNFFCLHLTTIGKSNPQKKDLERPVIGNNVTLGANVMILGDIKIGDNVFYLESNQTCIKASIRYKRGILI